MLSKLSWACWWLDPCLCLTLSGVCHPSRLFKILKLRVLPFGVILQSILENLLPDLLHLLLSHIFSWWWMLLCLSHFIRRYLVLIFHGEFFSIGKIARNWRSRCFGWRNGLWALLVIISLMMEFFVGYSANTWSVHLRAH